MFRSSVQTLHYSIVDTDGKSVDYVVDPEKYLVKGKDPKKRNIYRFTSNIATPALAKTVVDPKNPLDPARVAAFAKNAADYCAAIKEYDSCEYILKDGKRVKRIVTIAAEADGVTPLDIIALMEKGIEDALKLRGQKQCYKRNAPRAIETISKELGQTLASKPAKKVREDEADEDWEPEVTGDEEEVA
jgi:hypothetical protein